RRGRRAEHVVGKDARVDLEVPKHRLARRLDELRRLDPRRVRVEIVDQLAPHLRRREEVDRHTIRLFVPERRLDAFARVHALILATREATLVDVEDERDPFAELVQEAVDSLPPGLRAEMSNVEIVVEDEPPGGRPLLGLYHGIPLTRRTSSYAGVL